MNFRTASLDLPQKEQRRCLSWDISVGTGKNGQREQRYGTASEASRTMPSIPAHAFSVPQAGPTVEKAPKG